MAYLVLLCVFCRNNKITEVYHLSKRLIYRIKIQGMNSSCQQFFILSVIQLCLLKNKIWTSLLFGQVCACVGVGTQANQNPNISIPFFSGQNLNSGAPRLLVLIPQPKIHAIYSRQHFDSAESKQYLHNLRQIDKQNDLN